MFLRIANEFTRIYVFVDCPFIYCTSTLILASLALIFESMPISIPLQDIYKVQSYSYVLRVNLHHLRLR